MAGNGQEKPVGLVTVSAQWTMLRSLAGNFHEGIRQTATPPEGATIAIQALTRPVLANSSPV